MNLFMRLLDWYYVLRPAIPRSLQIRFRRGLAARRLRREAYRWPILESAGRAPSGWAGWPDGKDFAFVLTHDAETDVGQAGCRHIMDLEESLGFRSSFNFVPERYAVSSALREEMRRRGFEVGVHGLVHDGRLFHSRRLFLRRAARINDYLAEWNACGFRAPSMIVNLDWIHDLNMAYDSSTVDWDPFQPAPECVETIFPFWRQAADRETGYVELPCTMPQDFTLFTLMRETTIDIWKRKLDWVAERGGMALFDTHPDYMKFDGGSCGLEEYPVALYRELLQYARDRYGDRYWHALPSEVAACCAEPLRRHPRRRRRRICMVAYAYYDHDNRIRRYAETLVAEGDHVDAIALRRPDEPERGILNGVHVWRIQSRRRDEKHQLVYVFRILKFLWKSFWTLSVKHMREPYDVVHVHSVPDFEVFAAWLAKMTGAKVILDIHDIVPEFYASKFGVNPGSWRYRLLLLAEKWSTAFADHVIISNHLWYQKLVDRAVPADKCDVILNYTDNTLFSPRQHRPPDGQFIIVYPGGLQWHQGLDLAIRAFAQVAPRIPHAEFHIYGDGSEAGRLRDLVDSLGLQDRVFLEGMVSFDEIPDILARADLGVVAKRNTPFGGEAYSTKILEYMSQGLPVLAARTRIDTYYFNDDTVLFFEPDNADDMARKMIMLIQDPAQRQRLAERGKACFAANNWETKKNVYLDRVDALTGVERDRSAARS